MPASRIRQLEPKRIDELRRYLAKISALWDDTRYGV
jgi:hypothetical protein